MDEATKHFIEQLQQDIETNRRTADAWNELGKHNARLYDLDGKEVASAREMAEYYRRREKELRGLIENVKQAGSR